MPAVGTMSATPFAPMFPSVVGNILKVGMCPHAISLWPSLAPGRSGGQSWLPSLLLGGSPMRPMFHTVAHACSRSRFLTNGKSMTSFLHFYSYESVALD